MKDLASFALDTATQRGATYADVRVVDERSRALATKNGKIANASDSQSQGFSVRVLMNGAWGFASSADLGRSSVEATAARAVEIARASAKVKQSDVKLVPEQAVTARISISGLCTASIRATASSIPGSVSIRIGFTLTPLN